MLQSDLQRAQQHRPRRYDRDGFYAARGLFAYEALLPLGRAALEEIAAQGLDVHLQLEVSWDGTAYWNASSGEAHVTEYMLADALRSVLEAAAVTA